MGSSSVNATRTILFVATACLGWAARCAAVSVTGADWIVHYNFPDQSSSFSTTNADEYGIRDALVARINALQSGQTGALATYTFSGSNATVGASGTILNAIIAALDRGARIQFVVDSGVDTNGMHGGSNTLAALTRRGVNPLVLSVGPSDGGIMHHKVGIFDYGPTNRWVFSGSWNFTAAACSEQWNAAVEIRNETLFQAYRLELNELLAGRFHGDTNKSHAPDRTVFTMADSWGPCWVRFAPYPDGRTSGTNAQTDITNVMAGARSEIIFALDRVNRTLVQSQLVFAANRGLMIHGTIPVSDRNSVSDTSYAFYNFLTNTANYTTTNRVNFMDAYVRATNVTRDTGTSDLVHEKWMVIDPWESRPTLIHGSPNWTDAATVDDLSNDENLLFLRHREIARIFYAQYQKMTGTWTNRDDFWCDVRRAGGPTEVGLWTTDTNRFLVEHTPQIGPTWTTVVNTVTSFIGRSVLSTNGADPSGFYRARRE
jgi:phosphatidylserine/phosphatidylglycerophosphate/cardiolipin synthase-like enzyme